MTCLVNIEVSTTVFWTRLSSFLSKGSCRESKIVRTSFLTSTRLAPCSAFQKRVDRENASWTAFLLSSSL